MKSLPKHLQSVSTGDAARAATDPMGLLDGIIRELEDTREAALIAIATANPREQAELGAALRELEGKLALSRDKRDEVRARMARTDRIKALVTEMSALRDEGLALAKQHPRDQAREAALKARIEEIRTEAESLRQKSE